MAMAETEVVEQNSSGEAHAFGRKKLKKQQLDDPTGHEEIVKQEKNSEPSSQQSTFDGSVTNVKKCLKRSSENSADVGEKRVKLGNFDAALFCAKLNCKNPQFVDICSRFLEAMKKESMQSAVIIDLCRASNNGAELVQWLSHTGRQMKAHAKRLRPAEQFLIVCCLKEILLFILRQTSTGESNSTAHSLGKAFCMRMTRAIASSKESLFVCYRQILPSDNINHAVASLDLLSYICLLDKEMCRTLLANIDFGHPCFKEALVRWPVQPAEGDLASVRSSLMALAIGILHQADEEMLKSLFTLPKHQAFLKSLFRHLYFDQPSVIVQFLLALRTAVDSAPNLSKAVKLGVFSPGVLMGLTYLFAWRPVKKVTMRSDAAETVEEMLKQDSWFEEDLCAEDESQSKIVSTVWDLLYSVCATDNGVVFPDHTFGLLPSTSRGLVDEIDSSDDEAFVISSSNIKSQEVARNCNYTITNFLGKLFRTRLVILPIVRRLAGSILSNSPDQYVHFFSALGSQLGLTHQAHERHILLARTVADVLNTSSANDWTSKDDCRINNTEPRYIIGQDLPSAFSEAGRFLACVACPPEISEHFLIPGIEYANIDVLLVTVGIFGAVSRRIEAIFKTLKLHEKTAELWYVIRSHLGSYLPSVAVLESLWTRLIQKRKDYGSVPLLDQATLNFVHVLKAYQLIDPAGLNAINLKMILCDICDHFSAPLLRTRLLLDVILVLATRDKDFQKLCTSLKSHPSPLKLLLQILKQHKTNNEDVDNSLSKKAGTVLFSVLDESQFLSPYRSEVTIWLNSIHSVDFLEALLRIALCNGYAYIDRLCVAAFFEDDTQQQSATSNDDILKRALAFEEHTKHGDSIETVVEDQLSSEGDMIGFSILTPICLELLPRQPQHSQPLIEDVEKTLSRIMHLIGGKEKKTFKALLKECAVKSPSLRCLRPSALKRLSVSGANDELHLASVKQELLEDIKPQLDESLQSVSDPNMKVTSTGDASLLEKAEAAYKELDIPNLLAVYNATLSTADRYILRRLQLIQIEANVSFAQFQPLLWGEAAESHYKNLRLLGPKLCPATSSDDVLDLLDASIVQETALQLPLRMRLLVEQDTEELSSLHGLSCGLLYDPCFLLPLLAKLLEPQCQINCRKLLEKNCIGLALSSLSSRDATMRGLGYLILLRYRRQLRKCENFVGKAQIVHLLYVLRQSIDQPNRRLPCIVGVFLVKAAALTLTPEDCIYSVVMEFLSVKPTLDLDNVPEFFKLFLSGSRLHFQRERRWMLLLLLDGLREAKDYRIYEKRGCFALLLSYYRSPLAAAGDKLTVLQIILRAVALPTVMLDLCRRSNLIGWISGQLHVTLEQLRNASVSASAVEAPLRKEFVGLFECLKTVWKTCCSSMENKVRRDASNRQLQLGSDVKPKEPVNNKVPRLFMCSLLNAISLAVNGLKFLPKKHIELNKCLVDSCALFDRVKDKLNTDFSSLCTVVDSC